MGKANDCRIAALLLWLVERRAMVALPQHANGKRMHRHWLIWNLVPAMWLAWCLYWSISAVNAKPNVRRESLISRASHVLPLTAGILLVALPHLPSPLFATRILPRTIATYWVGVGMIFLGLAFAVWARRHLGTNWSGTVTVKENHVLIRTGPYAWARHPIYTGLLAAVLGTAVARGELRGVWSLAICTVAFVIKLRIEERWMREVFGAEYERYSAEVPALIPLWPR
jgi:protein-S-isoprenylcysteine O-methyltransferase Ste14